MPTRRRGWRSWLVIALVVSTALTAILVAVSRLESIRPGLKARYSANDLWEPPIVKSIIDSHPSTPHFFEAWDGAPPAVFSVAWSGSIIALHDDTYSFSTISDDGSTVAIDGRLVVDNSGRHGTRQASGVVHLTRGAHDVVVRYFQAGGGMRFDFLWSRGGAPLEEVPAWALRPSAIRSPSKFVTGVIVGAALVTIEWIWFALLMLGVITIASALISRLLDWLRRQRGWQPGLRWVLAGSFVLNVIGIWWGLPAEWVATGLTRTDVLGAWAARFSHGWYHVYPPFHFYVLLIAMSPVAILEALGRIDPYGDLAFSIATLLNRSVSLVAAAGVLVAAYSCGARLFTARAGVCAAAMVALITPFLYYAKTTNLDGPYLFWFALAMVCYLRLLDAFRLRDFVGFAACAAVAICTKDQAYGLFVLPPVVIAIGLWRHLRAAGTSGAWWRAIVDRRMLAAALTAAIIFALSHNLLFNFHGFVDHVRLITGPGSQLYRRFDHTFAGHVELAELSAQLMRDSLGWPLLVIGLIGLVMILAAPGRRLLALALIAPLVSYYFTFINVILYNHDRFMMPVCFVLLVFGGCAIDRFLGSGRRPAVWRGAVLGAAFAYTLLYAATVDVLMIRDSRYDAEQWLRARVTPDALVGSCFGSDYLPNLAAFQHVDLCSTDDVNDAKPAYFVLNADYARSSAPDSPDGRMVAALHDGSLGYRMVFRYRAAAPWPWLPGAHPDLTGPRQDPHVNSTLRNINPTIEIFERDASRGAGR